MREEQKQESRRIDGISIWLGPVPGAAGNKANYAMPSVNLTDSILSLCLAVRSLYQPIADADQGRCDRLRAFIQDDQETTADILVCRVRNTALTGESAASGDISRSSSLCPLHRRKT